MKKLSLHIVLLFLSFSFFNACTTTQKSNEQIKILILSGRNNHAWEQTTPVLQRTFEESGCFEVDVTNQPDTFNFEIFRAYDVIVSNWNSWPENDIRWPETTEYGLLKFVEQGGGLVFFHASTSVFYEWPEFEKISTGAWKEETWHGEMCPVTVTIDDRDHPITKGMTGFCIFDELWFNAEKNDAFHILGSAGKKDEEGNEMESQPAIFVANHGKGRIFHTILGHDARTMRNTGFQALVLRGTEWAATSDVTIPLPQELREELPGENPDYNWFETDTTFGLLNHTDIVWQFNYNDFRGKPYFHPVYLGRNRITCVSPDDHIWHLGQWFSWKYINGVNYWEYTGKSYRSEGVTDITLVKLIKNPDFSAEIHLDIDYHPQDGETVLKEKRIITVSPPDNQKLWMDYELLSEAVSDRVDINRTPILGEPDGKSWGGYAGLSIRYNQDLMDASWISSNGDTSDVNGTTGDWLNMSFKGLDGDRIGSAMFVPDNTKREGWAWYLIDNPELPFYYFSPAYLYLAPLQLSKGDCIKLNYRILHISGEVTSEQLSSVYQSYINR